MENAFQAKKGLARALCRGYPVQMTRGNMTAVAADMPADVAEGQGSSLAGLAQALTDTLPTGSHVVVCWRDTASAAAEVDTGKGSDASIGDGVAIADDAPASLVTRARDGLDGHGPAGDEGTVVEGR